MESVLDFFGRWGTQEALTAALVVVTGLLVWGTFRLSASTRSLARIASENFAVEKMPVPSLDWSCVSLGKGGLLEAGAQVLSANQIPIFVDSEEVAGDLVALSADQGHFADVKLNSWVDHRQRIHVWIATDDLGRPRGVAPEFGLRLTFGVYTPSVTDVQLWSAIVAFVDTPSEVVESGADPYTAHALGPICRCGDRVCEKRQERAIEATREAFAGSA